MSETPVTDFAALMGPTDIEIEIQSRLRIAFAAEFEREFGWPLADAREPHVHEWEPAYVLERMTREQSGDPRVMRCLPCGEIRDLT